MKPVILGIVLALAVLVTGYMFTLPLAPSLTNETQNLLTYASEVHGVSFSYPAEYLLAEEEQGDYKSGHYAITLIHENDAVPVIGGGEGPTAVTIDIYENTEEQTLYAWVTNTNESDYHLGDGTYASTSVGSAEAIHYGWSGLYEGETIAFLHEGSVVAVSVTYQSPADEVRTVFETVLDTFVLR